jgi:hypothetical protein
LLSDHFVFKSQWADVAVGTVPPVSVVVNLTVFEDGLAHVLAGGGVLTVYHLHLEYENHDFA